MLPSRSFLLRCSFALTLMCVADSFFMQTRLKIDFQRVATNQLCRWCGGYRAVTESGSEAETRASYTDQKDVLLDPLAVELGDRSYPIYIDRGILCREDIFRSHIKSKKCLIVTNTRVGPLYSATVKDSLMRAGVQEVHEVVLPDGEEFKTFDVLMQIIDAAMEHKLDRKSTMVALGGGVIGDMCGFAAAIYQRGINFVQVPTTLMAMVDSAVGGKTAVNHPRGKNMIGAFYQPEAVVIDTDTLSSLPDRELRSGISEIIKYGLIKDAAFFDWQEQHMDEICARDPSALREAIRQSCVNKAQVVAADEREGSAGIRATLNLGHTFGHAIETGFGYGAWLHGEAVGAGIAMAAEMSHRMGSIDVQVLHRTRDLLVRAGLPIDLGNPSAALAMGARQQAAAQGDAGAGSAMENGVRSDASAASATGVTPSGSGAGAGKGGSEETGSEEYARRRVALTAEVFLELMSMDKKVADGQLSLVLLRGALGGCELTNAFDVQVLRDVVAQYTAPPTTTLDT